jgi:excisionase family DNA binding protein
MSTSTLAQEPGAAENWTIQDVARFLRCSERTVYSLMRTGKIPQPRRLGNRWLFDASKMRAVLGD